VKLKLATTAAVGDFVGSDAAGKASTAATVKCAIIIEAGAVDELVEAITFKPV
jgi:hypothetical protein